MSNKHEKRDDIMSSFEEISTDLSKRMETEKKDGSFPKVGFDRSNITRRRIRPSDQSCVWRPPFAKDIDKIIHCPYYNRYSDKTQVFSLINNDDITRRGLHVQIVSRIARTIGYALNLNLDLIEAIALGHDMGHPPFAHTGEIYLDALSYEHTGRHFYHNIHSVRVLDDIIPLNLTLQVLDGIACHNGEIELDEYRPIPMPDFKVFDKMIERCYTDRQYAARIMPSTLEGSVVRISDIIAYLGRDRLDAERVSVIDEHTFSNEGLGSVNSEIINNLVVNIIENSYGKPYIKLDKPHFEALKAAKRDNYEFIYENAAARSSLESTVKPMMWQMYGQLVDDLKQNKQSSPIYAHHIDYINKSYYRKNKPYTAQDPNQVVIDFIASMTDDYFIDLYRYLFPHSDIEVKYRSYFD